MRFERGVLAPAPWGKPRLLHLALEKEPARGQTMKSPSSSTKTVIAALGFLVASVFQYVTPHSQHLLNNLFQKLYYLPIIYAAITFGWRGGLAVAVASTICYGPTS